MTHPDILKMERDGYLVAPVAVCRCDLCGDEIYVGEDLYRLDGKCYCHWCVESSREDAGCD